MAFFHYALCVLCLHFATVKCIEFQGNGIDSNLIVPKDNSIRSLEQNKIISSPVCDCGPNSEKCELVEGEKVCKCNFKYRQVDGFCEPFCQKWYYCDNGAPCVNESCQCLPGTRGSFCEIVDECEGDKGPLKCGDPEKVLCRYNEKSQKADCMCRTFDYLYDASRRKCVECDCNKEYGSCSLVDGVKSCKCNPGTAVKKENIGFGYPSHYRCSPCDCGNYSNGCSFKDISGLEIYWTQICDCKEGYYEQQGWTKTCEECECGHGTCYSSSFSVGCNCDDGYKSFLTKDRRNITCKECDCGGNGVCSFKEEEKKCQCDKYFAERDGKCVACQCYANDETVDCYFEGKTQHCLCPEGYENGTFVCKDINECLNSDDVCPRNTYCVNTPGSFDCPCVKGYEPREEGGDPKVVGCVDIDECQIESMCPPVHTLCINLPGTYKCDCEWGYEPVTPYESPVVAGCQPRRIKSVSSPWKTGVIIIGVIFGLCIAGLGIAIFIKRRSGGQLPRTDTVLQRMR